MKHVRAAVLMGSALFCVSFLACGGAGSHTSANPAPQLTSLEITTPSTSVPLGATARLTANGTYSDGTKKDFTHTVTWSSSSEAVAKMSTPGNLSAVAKGTATITATYNSMTATVAITVGDPALMSIEVDLKALTTAPNTRQQLLATGIYTDGSARDVTDEAVWTTSDTTIAKIGPSGALEAISTGSATITASDSSGTIKGANAVTVTSETLNRLAIVPYQPVLGIGVSQHLSAIGRFVIPDTYSVHEIANLTWSSSDPTVVSITDRGDITTVKAGNATITATANGVSDTTVVTVLPATLVSISIHPSPLNMSAGTTQQLSAADTFADGSTAPLPLVTWGTSSANLAAVREDGLLSAKAPGSVIVTAALGGITGSGTVAIGNATLQSITITPDALTIPRLALKQFHATGRFSDGSTQDLTRSVVWISSTPAIAKIRRFGLTSTAGAGSTQISAVLGSVSKATTLTVGPSRVVQAESHPYSPVIPEGVKILFALLGDLDDGTKIEIESPKWLSSYPHISTIDASGLVVGRRTGTTRLYGEGCCQTAYTPLAVNSAVIAGVTVTCESTSIDVGSATTCRAVGAFSDGTSFDISNAVHWSSSNPAASTVDSTGVAHGIAGGSCNVVATFGPVDGSSTTASGNAQLTIAVPAQALQR